MNPHLINDLAVAVALPFRTDAQSNALLMTGAGHCQVFFRLRDEQDNERPRLGKLSFAHSWATGSFGLEGGGIFVRADSSSFDFLCRIENSSWLEQCTKTRVARYPDWLAWDKRVYHHFVFSGHDNYVQIIAERFEAAIATEVENELFYALC